MNNFTTIVGHDASGTFSYTECEMVLLHSTIPNPTCRRRYFRPRPRTGVVIDDRRMVMARCEVCGNDHDNVVDGRRAGETHVFDSFECEIRVLAPSCAHCNCKIMGHGLRSEAALVLQKLRS
jgi:hypothetical protein